MVMKITVSNARKATPYVTVDARTVMTLTQIAKIAQVITAQSATMATLNSSTPTTACTILLTGSEACA